MARGGKRPGAGRKVGHVALDKQAAREVAVKFVAAHLLPILRSQLAAAIGTHKLMLRREDGTWRAATAADDVEKALNGDPSLYWIAPNPPNTQAASTLLGYGLDKPKEQEQEFKVTGDAIAVLARLDAWKRARRQEKT